MVYEVYHLHSNSFIRAPVGRVGVLSLGSYPGFLIFFPMFLGFFLASEYFSRYVLISPVYVWVHVIS